MNIQIEKINYFGDIDMNYNAKVVYTKFGKVKLAHVYIDYFNCEVFIPKQQPKECKVLKGLYKAIKNHIFSK